MRGPIKYQVSQVWQKLDGIGISKAEYRKENPVKNVDDTRPTSPLVHSFQYKDEIFKTAKNLFTYAHRRGIKDMTKITIDIVENWFENKMDDDVSRGTLRNYLAHIVKIQIALQSISNEEGNDYIGYRKEELSDIHKKVKKMDRNKYINRAYHKPGLMVGMLRDAHENLCGILQWRYGLRVTEASHIKLKQLSGNTLTVYGKGGFVQIVELSDEDGDELRKLSIDELFKVNQNHYRKSLEEAAAMINEKYNGTHGLRYNFAQHYFHHQFDELRRIYPLKVAHDMALERTSNALGHRRKEITYRYLGAA